jgi:hypothetical protein
MNNCRFSAKHAALRRKSKTSSTTKTGRHDIAAILLKVALNTEIQIHSFPTCKKKKK